MVICAAEEKVASISLFFLALCIFLANCETVSEDETLLKEFMICRQCGSDVSLSNFLINKLSPSARYATNRTLFNTLDVLVQDLENPLGARFRIILLKTAFCAKIDNWSNSYTWFPGYSWKLCFCPKCSVHLGWMYEPIETASKSQIFPSDQGFYALILNNVLAESYVNSLLVTEKYLREL